MAPQTRPLPRPARPTDAFEDDWDYEDVTEGTAADDGPSGFNLRAASLVPIAIFVLLLIAFEGPHAIVVGGIIGLVMFLMTWPTLNVPRPDEDDD